MTEFNYRISDEKSAHVFVGIQISKRSDAVTIAKAFTKAGFETLDLTDDELAKVHVRHLVGGRSPLAQDERLLPFPVSGAPRCPDAISHPDGPGLEHFRCSTTATMAPITAAYWWALQVPAQDKRKFSAFLDDIGYPYIDETQHPAYRMFLSA